jgi:hypothetical protein
MCYARILCAFKKKEHRTLPILLSYAPFFSTSRDPVLLVNSAFGFTTRFALALTRVFARNKDLSFGIVASVYVLQLCMVANVRPFAQDAMNRTAMTQTALMLFSAIVKREYMNMTWHGQFGLPSIIFLIVLVNAYRNVLIAWTRWYTAGKTIWKGWKIDPGPTGKFARVVDRLQQRVENSWLVRSVLSCIRVLQNSHAVRMAVSLMAAVKSRFSLCELAIRAVKKRALGAMTQRLSALDTQLRGPRSQGFSSLAAPAAWADHLHGKYFEQVIDALVNEQQDSSFNFEQQLARMDTYACTPACVARAKPRS